MTFCEYSPVNFDRSFKAVVCRAFRSGLGARVAFVYTSLSWGIVWLGVDRVRDWGIRLLIMSVCGSRSAGLVLLRVFQNSTKYRKTKNRKIASKKRRKKKKNVSSERREKKREWAMRHPIRREGMWNNITLTIPTQKLMLYHLETFWSKIGAFSSWAESSAYRSPSFLFLPKDGACFTLSVHGIW